MAADQELFLSDDDADKDEYLLKHVNAVALMPVIGGRKISLLGRRLFNVLLHHSMNNPDNEEHQAGLSEIVEMADINSRNFEQIKKTLRELMTTTVEWQSPAQNEFVETWDACNLLSGVGITKNKSSGHVTVRWRFDSKVRENILRPEIYSRLSLASMTKFSTHGALALYEICARYVNNPSHLTTRRNWREWWLPVLSGVSNEKPTTEYRFFKRDVLKKAIAEINAKSNLEVVGPIEYKGSDGKTVNDIQFKVKFKSNSEELSSGDFSDNVNFTGEQLPVVGRAISLGVTQNEITKLITEYPLVMISIGLDDLETRISIPTQKVRPITKPGAWLKAVLKRIDNAQTKAAVKPVDVEKQKSEWVQEWLKKEKEKLLYAFEDSTEEEKQEIRRTFEEYLVSLAQSILVRQLKKYDKDSPTAKHYWEDRMLSALFIQFLGITKKGADWDKPTAEDLLAIAAKAMAPK
jgi:hypothetical protein